MLNRKSSKHLRHFLKSTYFCDEKGDFVNVEQIANPGYDPWIKCHVDIRDLRKEKETSLSRKKKSNTNKNWRIYKSPVYSVFYYHFKTNRLFKERSTDGAWIRLKSGKMRWKKLIEKILEKEPNIWPLWGKSILDQGYFYAPYIPMLKTPTTLGNSFLGNKSLKTRFTGKFISAQHYSSVKITNK